MVCRYTCVNEVNFINLQIDKDMGKKTIEELKKLFKTGAIPTEQDFGDLIDSLNVDAMTASEVDSIIDESFNDMA